MNRSQQKSYTCPNCKNPLEDQDFCPQCGQKNDVRKLTLGHVLSESISNLLAFDGRFFFTLRNLFRHPGKVPKQYIKGVRTKYMNPVRIYFLSSILLLGIAQLSRNSTGIVKIQDTSSPQELIDTNSLIPKDLPVSVNLNDDDVPWFLKRMENMSMFYNKHKAIATEEALDSLEYENTLTNRFLYRQSVKSENFNADEFNRLLFSKLFWVLFAFLPILALLLKLLYIRGKRYYMEHLFFTFFNQSVFFLLLSLVIPWPEQISDVLFIIIFLGFGIYQVMSMKNFYNQSFSKTIIKFLIVNVLAIPCFLILLIAFVLLTYIIF